MSQPTSAYNQRALHTRRKNTKASQRNKKRQQDILKQHPRQQRTQLFFILGHCIPNSHSNSDRSALATRHKATYAVIACDGVGTWTPCAAEQLLYGAKESVVVLFNIVTIGGTVLGWVCTASQHHIAL